MLLFLVGRQHRAPLIGKRLRFVGVDHRDNYHRLKEKA
jgi:hypothetical protein